MPAEDGPEASRVGRVVRLLLARARPGSYVDPTWPTGALLAQLVTWPGNLVRGAVRLAHVPGARVRFCERGVAVHGGRNCRIGAWALLERDVTLRGHGGHGIHLGDRVVIGSFTVLEVASGLARNAGWIHIGERSCLGDHCYVGGAGGVTIGENVLCGQSVSFHAENHEFSDAGMLIRDQPVRHRGIQVHDDCWIGAGVRILDGVVIGRGAVVGAGAVVTRSVPAGSVVAGVPARVIGTRGEGGPAQGPPQNGVSEGGDSGPRSSAAS